MLNVYIAGRYQDREELRDFAKHLEAVGDYKVISSWLHEDYPPTVAMKDLTPHDMHLMAEKDIEEIQDANLMVLFSQSDTAPTYRNGRLVEFGVALSVGMTVFVVGPAENIFFHCDGVHLYPTKEDVLQALLKRSLTSALAVGN
jgi:hypothetical protein